jgi:hypothetical protein
MKGCLQLCITKPNLKKENIGNKKRNKIKGGRATLTDKKIKTKESLT